MKVFYFITKSHEGGAQTVVYELLRAHKTRGDTAIVMAGDANWLATETRALGFLFIENRFMRKTYNPLVLLQAAGQYRKAVREAKPNIVSCHSSFSGIIGRIFKCRGIPVIYTTHGWGFNYGKGGFKYLKVLAETIAGKFSRVIICVSNADKQVARRYGIAPERKLVVIYNGVSVPPSLGTVSVPARIVFVGRFAWPKRQDVLIDAFALLSKATQENAIVHFIGSGPEEIAVRKKVQEIGLERYFQFAGGIPREEALSQLSTAYALVLLSQSEGMPMSVLESLALGIPVIANDVGGIHEAVEAGVGILLPELPDATVCAVALERIIGDKELHASLCRGAAAQKERFSSTRMSKEVFELYDRIITRNE